MDFLPTLPYTMKLVMVLLAGVILLRLSGKRAIAQLTVPEAVLMIAIGTLLIQPAGSKNEWVAIYGSSILVAGMILLSYLQIGVPWIRKWIFGVPSVIVKDGKIDVKELKRVKMTTDQLEMRLRQLQVGNLSDIKMAVLEPSGNLSIIQKEQKKASQKEDIQKLLDEINSLKSLISHQQTSPFAIQQQPNSSITSPKSDTLFEESCL